MLSETFSDPSYAAITEDLDYYQITGIKRDHQLTETECNDFLAEEASDKHTRQAIRELPYLQVSRPVIAEKQQLSPGKNVLQGRPLAVLRGNCKRDYELMFQAGVANGQGSETQRAVVRGYLTKMDESVEAFQRELLNLFTLSRNSLTTKSGHNIQLTEPELVAYEIRWVLNNGSA